MITYTESCDTDTWRQDENPDDVYTQSWILMINDTPSIELGCWTEADNLSPATWGWQWYEHIPTNWHILTQPS